MPLVTDIQEAVAAYLASRDELAGVPIVSRRKGNIVTDIAAAVNRAGVCVYVFPALLARLNSNNPGPYVDEILIRCRVIEHPVLNTKGPNSYEVVEYLVRLLDEKQLTISAGTLNPLRWPAAPVEVVDDAEELVQHDVVAATSFGLEPRSA